MRDRILHLRSSRGLWGPENQILLLARHLPIEGFQVGALILYRSEQTSTIHPLVAAMRQVGLEADQIPDPWLSLGAVSVVVDRLRQGRFRLLHTHGYKADLVGLLATRRAGVRWVATAHGLYLRNARLRLYDRLDQLALRWADTIIAVSESERQRLLGLGLSASRIVRVHNAIDADTFSEGAKDLLAGCTDGGRRANRENTDQTLDRPKRLVLFVGRLNPQKGLTYLLESLCQITAEAPDVHFLIAGDGPLRSELEWHARELGVTRRITFLGFRADVTALMRAADVFVLPSVEEPFGIVLLEALVLARPVVATAVGGVPEIIKHGETGLLVPPRDPAALATAILQLLNDRAKAARLGEQGREHVRREFSATRMVRQTAAVYRAVLKM